MSIPSSDEERSSISDVLAAIFFILSIVFIFGFSIIHVLKHMQSIVPTTPSSCEDRPCTGATVPLYALPTASHAVLASLESVDITSLEKDPVLREKEIRDSFERAVHEEHHDIKAVTTNVDENGFLVRIRIHKYGPPLPLEVAVLLPGDELVLSRQLLVNYITNSGECRSLVGALTLPSAQRRILFLCYICNGKSQLAT